MFDKEMESIRLRNMAIKLFVKNGANCTQPNVIAAVANAASEMAINSGIASKEDVFNAIIEAFGAQGREDIISMADGMNPSVVRSVIGYSVDFMDFGSAVANYNAQKAEYDALYKEVNYFNMNKGKTL